MRRTIFVPAESVGPVDFDITEEEPGALYDRGLQAAQHFLESWNYADYLTACRGEPSPAPSPSPPLQKVSRRSNSLTFRVHVVELRESRNPY